MSNYAVVGMFPIEEEGRSLDFAHKEVDTIEQACDAIKEFTNGKRGWRMVHLVHIEDLPLLMQPPPGATGTDVAGPIDI